MRLVTGPTHSLIIPKRNVENPRRDMEENTHNNSHNELNKPLPGTMKDILIKLNGKVSITHRSFNLTSMQSKEVKLPSKSTGVLPAPVDSKVTSSLTRLETLMIINSL